MNFTPFFCCLDETEIFLNKRGVTEDVWEHLSWELPNLKRGRESYDGFYVASNRPGNRKGSAWDMILKVYYTNQLDKTSHIKLSINFEKNQNAHY